MKVRTLLGAAIAMAAFSMTANAEICSERIDRLAAEHGLAIETPPLANPSDEQGEASERLAQSGGVVRPPAVGDAGVLPPPVSGDRMPTNPTARDIPEPEKKAAQQAQAGALLQAARNDADRGDEAGCLAKLAQAEGELAELRGGNRR